MVPTPGNGMSSKSFNCTCFRSIYDTCVHPGVGTVGKDLADVRAKLGRKLTPINVTTYGWYYTW